VTTSETWSAQRLWIGRLNRSRFFQAILLVPVCALVLLIPFIIWYAISGPANPSSDPNIPIPYEVVVAAFVYVMNAGLAIRRLHDVGLSGFVALAFTIPLIGFCLTLYLLVREGTRDVNRYGPPPDERKGLLRAVFNY